MANTWKYLTSRDDPKICCPYSNFDYTSGFLVKFRKNEYKLLNIMEFSLPPQFCATKYQNMLGILPQIFNGIIQNIL